MSVRVDIFSEYLDEVIESYPFVQDVLQFLKLLDDLDRHVPK